MRYGLLACMVLVPALPVMAQDAPPEIRKFDIATIEKLGREMYFFPGFRRNRCWVRSRRFRRWG